jgi:hypothetical protein
MHWLTVRGDNYDQCAFSILFVVLFFSLTSWSAFSIEGELSAAVRNNDSAKIEELVTAAICTTVLPV